MKKIIKWILLVLWLVTIFWFSAKPADESADMSMRVGRFVAGLFVMDFDNWTEEDQYALAEKIDYPIRKTAHATEYALAAILFLVVYGDYEKWKRQKYSIAFWSTTFYAATDEFHQLFVPGRSGQITDVVIDSMGALVGLMFICMIQALVSKGLSRS